MFDRGFWVFPLGVIASASYLVAGTLDTILEARLRNGVGLRTRVEAATPTIAGSLPLSAFLERNLFGAKRGDLERGPGVPARLESVGDGECRPSMAGVVLLATFVVHDDSEASSAVFRTPDGQVLRLESGAVADVAGELREISWRRVRLSREGRCEILDLNDPPAMLTGLVPEGPSPASAIRAEGDGRYTIPRAELDRVLSDLGSLATEVRLFPVSSGGRTSGFRVGSLKNGGLFAQAGLRNGDIIRRVEGHEITGPEIALELFAKFRSAQQIAVDVERGGKPMTLTYEVR